MSDPRTRSDYRTSAETNERTLLAARQLGQSGEHEAREINIENVRRLEEDGEAVQSAPIRAATPATPAIEKPEEAPADRIHKDAPAYVVVSKDHGPGEDKIPNPGYRSPAATASTLNDGYTKAKVYAARNPGKRVVLQIWGGYWTEDLLLTTDLIDIEGIGRPIMLGKLTALAAAKDVMVRGLEVANTTSLFALEAQELASTLAVGEDLVFIDCRFRTPVNSSWIKRPAVFIDCKFYSESTSAEDPVVICQRVGLGWSATKYIKFFNCRVFASEIATLSAMKGCAVYITTTTVSPPVYTAVNALGLTTLSGWVYFESCHIRGWCRNEGWNLWFNKCQLFAGKRISPDPGGIFDIFSFANGNAVEGGALEPNTIFDKCTIACRYIQEGNGLANPNVWIIDTVQTYNGGAALGSTCWNNILNLYGVPVAMNVYVTSGSRSWRAHWYFQVGVPPNEGALTLLGGTETFVHPNDILAAPAASIASSINPTP